MTFHCVLLEYTRAVYYKFWIVIIDSKFNNGYQLDYDYQTGNPITLKLIDVPN